MVIRDVPKYQHQAYKKRYKDYRLGPEAYGVVESNTYDKTGNLKSRFQSIMAVRKVRRTPESGVILKALMDEAFAAGWATSDIMRATGLTRGACQKPKPEEE